MSEWAGNLGLNYQATSVCSKRQPYLMHLDGFAQGWVGKQCQGLQGCRAAKTESSLKGSGMARWDVPCGLQAFSFLLDSQGPLGSKILCDQESYHQGALRPRVGVCLRV